MQEPACLCLQIAPIRKVAHTPQHGAHQGVSAANSLGMWSTPAAQGAMKECLRAHHHAIVRLAADDPSDALRGLPHRVEGQVVVLLDLERLRQVLQPRPAQSSIP